MFDYWLGITANLAQLESYRLLLKDANNSELLNDLIKQDELLKTIVNQNKEIINLLKKEDKSMEEMNQRSEYVGGGYRDYRGNYRYGNRDYRDEYGRNQRNMRNYRDYREEDLYEQIGEAIYEAKECHRKMEDLAEMTDDPQIKNTLNKIAMREKEHYQSLKELMEK